MSDWLTAAHRGSPWSSLRVCVAGAAVSGLAAAEVLLHLGSEVVLVDARDGEREWVRAARLEVLGAQVRLGDAETLPSDVDLVVTSPGWRPDQPLLQQAERAGVPVWGEVELAWRLRAPDGAAPWLCVTGTNGKTTTVRMLAAMLEAAGLRTVAAGNVGTPLLEAVMAPAPYDVIVAELSSFQLHWSRSLRAGAAAVLNVAPDHLDWHGDLAAYAADKARVYDGCVGARVYNAADPLTERLAREAHAGPGSHPVGFTRGVPVPGQVGVADGALVDHAFHAGGVELAAVADVRPSGPHNLENALAAAALARAHGVPPAAVREGLAAFRPDPHRVSDVATVGGVRYVDDSKATNPHAAAASLAGYPSVVWIAGGLAKGARFEELVREGAPRLRAAVLLGADRQLLAASLARHAPDVPVVDVPDRDTGAMDRAVTAAARLARPGDTVLLAPACASMDLFRDYAERGDAFAAAVRRLAGGTDAIG